jgi:hypothetical protein
MRCWQIVVLALFLVITTSADAEHHQHKSRSEASSVLLQQQHQRNCPHCSADAPFTPADPTNSNLNPETIMLLTWLRTLPAMAKVVNWPL